MQRLVFFLLLVLGLFVWACGAAEKPPKGNEGTVADQADTTRVDSTEKAVEAVPVEAALVKTGEISSFLLFSSTIETEKSVQIFAQLGGLVQQVRVEEGDQVVKGDTLVVLDDEDVHIEYMESQANLTHLEAGYKRTEEMFRRELVSGQEYEDKKFSYDQARLRFEKARIAQEHTVIRAPFTGVLTTRQVQSGARINTSTLLFDLIKLDDLISRVFVPGQYLMAVSKGQSVTMESDFLADMRFEGWVKRISPVIDPKSGTFKVTVGVKDRWQYLRPGLFVSVRIITDTHTDAVLVPKEAVVYDGGDRFVFVVAEDSTATKIPLDAGFENSRFVEALSGVEMGVAIIVIGQNGLKDKAKVKIVNKTFKPDTATALPPADQG
jgi:membrane fusion protein (multidrug efflux system)